MRRAKVPMELEELFRRMRNELVKLYPDKDDSKVVVHDSGIDSRFIAFSDQAENNWFSILQEAENQDKVETLVDCIIYQRFLENESSSVKKRLQRLCAAYRKYRESDQKQAETDVKPTRAIYAKALKNPLPPSVGSGPVSKIKGRPSINLALIKKIADLKTPAYHRRYRPYRQ
jgi:hypothetical protein